ncbi:cation transporter [Nitrosopumilus zosterae]|uniref:Cation transporter n=1 Tax=Nitrosopumilus zosterae TaxID=718286 RepID=A0A2S2KSH8_9ARCH|nr:cation diffusion facilitator family transporter [Nitrosopumilus zosterae]BDQ30745.1 cation diffusion facilitator family transporter [Nitrosopumilus zosterae]GBH34640.1 cation transporter [Nitrosopumilus zosterae]
MASGSTRAVYAALFGNLGIAVTKFIAAAMTGSASMWAESYHSTSDTVNQILLLLGIKISKKPATDLHQFGFGKSQFFWSFIVATMIFGISGILSLEQGFSSLLGTGHHFENPVINYIVLAIAFGFEANALRIALIQFKKPIKERGESILPSTLYNEFKNSKDTSILTVVVEDTAALLGIGIAAVGIFLTDITENTVYDSISSIIIGILLMSFAFFLAKENRGLLIGESISPEQRKQIVDIVTAIPEVNKVVTIKTMHLSPTVIIVGIEVNLIDGLDTDKIEIITDVIEHKIMKILPNSNKEYVFVEIER